MPSERCERIAPPSNENTLAPHAVGEIAPVPCGKREAGAVALDHLLQRRRFALGLDQRRPPHPVHQSRSGGRRLGHRVFDREFGIAGIAEQLRPLVAKGDDLGDHRVIVERPGLAPFGKGAPHPLAHRPVVGKGQQPLVGPAIDDEQQPTVQAPRVGGTGGKRAHVLGNARGLVLGKDELGRIGRVQDILAEAHAQFGQAAC